MDGGKGQKRKAHDDTEGEPSGKKAKMEWVCPYCNKIFDDKSNKQRHIWTHTKKAPCPFCNHKFSRSDVLTKHIDRVHKSEAKRCDICDAELAAAGGKPTQNEVFTSTKALSLHMWKHHFEVVDPLLADIQEDTPRPSTSPAGAVTTNATNQHTDTSEESPMELSDADTTAETSSDEEDIPELIPDSALAGPVPPIVSSNHDAYDWFHEPKAMIPQDIWDGMYQHLPEGSEQQILSEWDRLRSNINEIDERVRAYNYRLIGANRMDPREYFEWLFNRIVEQTSAAFRVRASLHLLLQHKTTGEFRVFYASNNVALRIPGDDQGSPYFLVHDSITKDQFMEALSPSSIQTLTERNSDSTQWKVSRVIGTQFSVLRIDNRPIGASEPMPEHLRWNKHLRKYRQDHYGNYYTDNLCVFRFVEDVLGNKDGKLEQAAVLKNFNDYCKEYNITPNAETFKGVNLDDLDRIEYFFGLRIQVYHMTEEYKINLIRKAVTIKDKDTPLFYAHMHETESGKLHFSRILNLKRMGKAFFCDFCGKEFQHHQSLNRHTSKSQCSRGITNLNFPGGLYSGTKSIFKQLKEVGITFTEPDAKLFYPWRAVFDFESLLKNTQLKIHRPQNKTEHENEIRKTMTDLNFEIEESDEPLKKLQFLKAHIPVAFSIVPGYTEPRVISNGDQNALIKDFINHLEEMSEAAEAFLEEKYTCQIQQLDELLKTAKAEHEAQETAWLEKQESRDKEASKENQASKDKDENKTKRRGTPAGIWLKKISSLKNQFASWRSGLVVIGFNSGRYDLNLIKEFLYPNLVLTAKEALKDKLKNGSIKGFDERTLKKLKLSAVNKRNQEGDEGHDTFFINEVIEENENAQVQSTVAPNPPENKALPIREMPIIIKNSTGILSLMTKSLKFLDMTRYMAAGNSLDKFLKAWATVDAIREQRGLPECEFGALKQTKIPFPYSFLDSLDKLEFEGVPAKECFKDNLRKKQISEEDYQQIVDLYREEGFKNFRDYLHHYVMLDTVPFLQAVNKTFMQWWDISGIDIFKECLSLPGLTMKYMEQQTPGRFDFSLFEKKDSELYQSLRNGLCGGLAVVNNRHAKVGETCIRGNPKHIVKNIIGLDENALYLASLARDMPTGFFDHWIPKNSRNLWKKKTNRPIAQQCLEYMATSKNINLIYANRCGYEKRVGPRQLPCDGVDEENKTVYEFLGCYWHLHCPSKCPWSKVHDRKQTNTKINTTVADCQHELDDRKAYIESLGYKFVYIWECEWREQRELDHVKAVLNQIAPRKFKELTYVKTIDMLKAIKKGQVFGFVKLDIHTPDKLKPFFSDFPPIIKHASVGIEDVGDHMKQWCLENDEMKKPRDALIGSYFGEGVWLLTPILKYLLKKGLVVTKIHEVVQYDREAKFEWFRDQVSEKRAEADSAKELAMIGESFKLLGNTGYGKTLTDLQNHKVITLMEVDSLRQAINDPFLESVEIICDNAYEVTMRPRTKKMNLPVQIGLAVYQYAKLYMMEFAYDVLGKYADKRKYDWMESDTDSIYLMMDCDDFDDIILPEKKDKYMAVKHKYMVIDEKKDKRTPGLMKVEYNHGQEMVCLCPKTYAIHGKDEDKLSCKGLMKRTNDLEVTQFKKVLETKKAGVGVNIGFMQKNNKIQTYAQERAGLSYLYIKRKVLADGISTVPLDI